MKLKIYLSLLLFFIICPFYAQVGIGTTSPNASSILDISSSNTGLLIPRVALTSTSDIGTIVSPAISLLVYNSGFAPNGYYYWNGTIWVQLTQSNSSWSLNGNAGTVASTNFLGTTDNVDIVFKRNTIRAGYIGDPIYNITTFDHINGNTSFGANSLVNPTVNVSTQTGVRNTAFGVNSMPGLTSGRLNVGIGDFSLFSNLSGNQNTAIGSGSLFTNSTASSNVAIGRNALTNSNANNNTAVGTSSLLQNSSGTGNTGIGRDALRGTTTPSPLGTPSTGSNNTALGYQSSLVNISGGNNVTIGTQSFSTNTAGSGNVGVGYQSGTLETGSNKLYIENSNADPSNALIYGEFDTNILRVNGTLQISNPATIGYSLPVNRGTNGQVLQTDGAGATSWVNSNTNFSLVRSTLNANQVIASTGWQKIAFSIIAYDLIGGEFSTVNNRFVATKPGYYEINAGFHTFNKSDTEQYAIAVYKNGVEYQETAAHHYGDKLISRIINCTLNLAVNDFVEIYIFSGNAPTTIDNYSGKTYFEVKQIR